MKRTIDDQVINKVGGRFKLSVLLQKRMREYFLSGTIGADRGGALLERAVEEVRREYIRLKPLELKEDQEEGDESDDEES
ncbi:MAG: hypothetical protein V2A58_08265 [Planctomycetota bacterium]